MEKGSAAFIDHTVLAATTTSAQIKTLCDEALANNFAAVCVNGGRVPQAVEALANSNVKVAAVVGFPLGASSPNSKINETFEYLARGATEIDYVIDIGRIKDRDYKHIFSNLIEIQENVRAFDMAALQRKNDLPKVKVILECALLTREEIIDASILCALARVDYVKTSTGFSTHGALEEHVRLMKQTVGNDISVKAAGGVRDKQALISMIYQGASRIGTSSGLKLIVSPTEAKELWAINDNKQ